MVSDYDLVVLRYNVRAAIGEARNSLTDYTRDRARTLVRLRFAYYKLARWGR